MYHIIALFLSVNHVAEVFLVSAVGVFIKLLFDNLADAVADKGWMNTATFPNFINAVFVVHGNDKDATRAKEHIITVLRYIGE